ncbi:MAG TPA: [FeFe] hydrogenase, group A [Anaerolineae bacterium]|nr:[FeFe] hydrogenase, group A [Anaerolineae bacterium]HOG45334.1 [FeFe] hydrogenase, group A [Anaerolineae bacterium]HOQ97244.1 [FeFe] hydrogenase, group A [Anaerolineae bacterium]HPL28772.1 [FeFe] hydrogenase, group A [Anaerolineae bacterium]
MAGYVTIDDTKVPIEGQRNLLEMVRQAGIDLPTFCYHSELSIYGACRMCVVEDARGQVVSSCSTPPADGMAIRTNTPRLMHIRRMMLELYLANHCRDCTTCAKNGNCKLQELCARFGVDRVRFPARQPTEALDLSTPGLVRDNNKCILCGDCVRMCTEVQGIGAIGFAYRGSQARVTPAYNRTLGEVNCVTCGQCAAVCPTGALTVRSEADKVWAALRNPQKHVVVQTAPAVRVAIGEAFGLEPGAISTGQMVGALRRLGFARIFDTSFAADLTTIEETNEFIARLQRHERLPQFTSCCPAWVQAAEQYYPEKLEQLSTCRSPQQMFGSVLKKHYTRQEGVDPADLFVVSVMPCTAKKFEAERPEFADDGRRDVDAVLTTQELARMIKAAGIIFGEVEEDSYDTPFGLATGAGVIYGASGGVATAVVREATYLLTGRRVTELALQPAPGLPGVMQAELDIAERPVRLAVVSGLGNTRRLLAAMDDGTAAYDIVEIMACPGGCAGGGGQPLPNETAQRTQRARGLRTADKRQQLRLAQDNVLVQELYRGWLGEPNGHTAHQALHTSYGHRRRIAAEAAGRQAPQVEIKACVGTSCYLHGARDVLRRLSEELERRGIEATVELQGAFCLERCDRGPNVVINGREYNHVREQDVPELLQQALAEAVPQPQH